MPLENLIKIVARNEKLTAKDWCTLVEKRRQMLIKHFDRFTLPGEFGRIECLKMESHQHEIRSDSPEFSGHVEFLNFGMKTRGIFGVQPYAARETGKITVGYGSPPDGKILIWGVVGTGYWVSITVDYVGLPGYKERGYEKAVRVDVRHSIIEEIVEEMKVEPKEIWQTLGTVAKDWLERSESRYQLVANLMCDIVGQDKILAEFENQKKFC